MINFSVIIPCFNCSKTLPATIDSCLNQSIKCKEIILIDDCSTEDITSIVNRYKNKASLKGINFLYKKLDNNMGPAYARNIGWNMSTGDYICFLDSDDIWHKDKLRIVKKEIDKYQCKIITHEYTESIHEMNFFYKKSFLRKISLFEMILKNQIATPCMTISRDIQERFDISMRYSEDYDLWLRLIKKYSIYKIEGKPLSGLLRPACTVGGLSGETFKMRIGEMKAYYNFLHGIEVVFFPLLFLYSIIKHARFKIKRIGKK